MMTLKERIKQTKAYMDIMGKCGVCFDWDTYEFPEDIPHVYDENGKRMDVDWAYISISGNTYVVEVSTPMEKERGREYRIEDNLTERDLDKWGIPQLIDDMRSEFELDDDRAAPCAYHHL